MNTMTIVKGEEVRWEHLVNVVNKAVQELHAEGEAWVELRPYVGGRVFLDPDGSIRVWIEEERSKGRVAHRGSITDLKVSDFESGPVFKAIALTLAGTPVGYCAVHGGVFYGTPPTQIRVGV